MSDFCRASGGESSSGGGGVGDLSAQQQQHLQSLSSSDAFHQCGSGSSSNLPAGPLSHHRHWEAQVEMDYSSAHAHHYMMPPPPPPNAHSFLSPQSSNVHPGHGQWTSPGEQAHLQSSSLMHHQHQHQHQLQQQQQQQQHCSDFQEQFAQHRHMVVPNNALVTLLHESPEDGRDAKRSAVVAAAGAPNQGTGEEPMSTSDSYKRPRIEQAAAAPFKTQVRKEKLGERITALQQLVSPFGKTDTASVLQEAIGYIKFLQDQVQVLSTPYMKPTMNSGSITHHDSQDLGSISNWASSNVKSTDHDVRQDLRSRGLCLVPVSCTLQVANDNGADFWTPAIGGGCR